MNDEHKEKIYYIQQQADELIKLGVFISMTCQELLDEE